MSKKNSNADNQVQVQLKNQVQIQIKNQVLIQISPNSGVKSDSSSLTTATLLIEKYSVSNRMITKADYTFHRCIFFICINVGVRCNVIAQQVFTLF